MKYFGHLVRGEISGHTELLFDFSQLARDNPGSRNQFLVFTDLPLPDFPPDTAHALAAEDDIGEQLELVKINDPLFNIDIFQESGKIIVLVDVRNQVFLLVCFPYFQEIPQIVMNNPMLTYIFPC